MVRRVEQMGEEEPQGDKRNARENERTLPLELQLAEHVRDEVGRARLATETGYREHQRRHGGVMLR